jgi:uncharacterized protein YciI
MLITIIRLDKPDQGDVRAAHRPAHSAHFAEHGPASPLFSGALFGDDGKSLIGTITVGDFDSLDAARAFHAADPYAIAGIYREVIIAPSLNVAKPA